MTGHRKTCLIGLVAMIGLTLSGCSVRNEDLSSWWKMWLRALKYAVQEVAEQTLTEQDLTNPFGPEPGGQEPALPEENSQPPEVTVPQPPEDMDTQPPEDMDTQSPESVDGEPQEEDSQPPEFVDSQGEDAETYYERRSEVLDVAEADVSASVHSEAEASANLTERGFDQYPVTTDYSLQGEYIGETEISSDSAEKHPVYETYYMSGEEIIWVIYEINGRVIADPVSYNLESGRNVRLVIAENTTLISYDGTMNRFYETIPDASVLFLKTVPRIDAEMLNNLTEGALDSLWE